MLFADDTYQYYTNVILATFPFTQTWWHIYSTGKPTSRPVIPVTNELLITLYNKTIPTLTDLKSHFEKGVVTNAESGCKREGAAGQQDFTTDSREGGVARFWSVWLQWPFTAEADSKCRPVCGSPVEV